MLLTASAFPFFLENIGKPPPEVPHIIYADIDKIVYLENIYINLLKNTDLIETLSNI